MTRHANNTQYDLMCRRCSRLARLLDEVHGEYPDYHCKPVPPFGDADARLLIVGLAPGKHGANATGRPFTGDHAGILLYRTLYDSGFSNNPVSIDVSDGMELTGCRITNAVKCLPPENKPTNEEITKCNTYLQAELSSCPEKSVILALGQVAHKAVLKAYDLVQAHFPFGHREVHRVGDGNVLLDSYHCSRYNTQTGRLTETMFKDVFDKARELMS